MSEKPIDKLKGQYSKILINELGKEKQILILLTQRQQKNQQQQTFLYQKIVYKVNYLGEKKNVTL